MWAPSFVVDVQGALDRRRAPVEHPVVHVAGRCRGAARPCHLDEAHFVDLERLLAGVRVPCSGAGLVARGRRSRCPWSASTCSGVAALARSTIACTVGSWAAICARSESLSACTCSSSASSISVLSNRLPRLSGAIRGRVSGARSARPGWRRRPARRGPATLTFRQAATASRSRSSGEAKRPALDSIKRCVESRLARSAPGRSSRSASPGSSAVGCARGADQGGARLGVLRTHAHPPMHGPLADELELAAGTVAEQVDERSPRQLDAALDRLMAVARDLEEPHLAPELGALAAEQHALDSQMVEGGLGGARRMPGGRRSRTASGSRSSWPRCVRVQRVALVEQRRDEAAGGPRSSLALLPEQLVDRGVVAR